MKGRTSLRSKSISCYNLTLYCMIMVCVYVPLRLQPEPERLYSCTYEFIARNSSELSVQQGETLEVMKSSSLCKITQ